MKCRNRRKSSTAFSVNRDDLLSVDSGFLFKQIFIVILIFKFQNKKEKNLLIITSGQVLSVSLEVSFVDKKTINFICWSQRHFRQQITRR